MVDEHRFGGGWTELKLDSVSRYLAAYQTALKKFGFRRIYIDAFAGTGSRSTEDQDAAITGDLFEFRELQDGSVRRALQLAIPFDQYILIENDTNRFETLRCVRDDFPHLKDRIVELKGDCNHRLPQVMESLTPKEHRAVVFLDPYGLQLNWETVKLLARSQIADVWILFPVSAVNRVLRKDSAFPVAWESRLDRLFGDTAWREAFYAVNHQVEFFEDIAEPSRKIATFEAIEAFYRKRLTEIFAKVAPSCQRLYSSSGQHLFSLFFACSNPNPTAHNLAVKIAKYILGK